MKQSWTGLRWNELILKLKLNNLKLSEEGIEKILHHDRCKLLNSIPVLVARHFQYLVECFFRQIVIDGALDKTKYYTIRVEFQVPGSPHIHCLTWILIAPILNESNVNEYVSFVDKIVHAYLYNKNENPDLHELAKLYQHHRHSKTCRKYRNDGCRFYFGKFFSTQTTVPKPLPSDMPGNMKYISVE